MSPLLLLAAEAASTVAILHEKAYQTYSIRLGRTMLALKRLLGARARLVSARHPDTRS
jgi:hypothetical protein